MPRTILAFNGDLESRLALDWLVQEKSYRVITLSINLGQELYLEPLGELALDLGATAAQVIDRREVFLHEFALPTMQADAIYQSSCFLGSALGRYLIAQELVRLARDEGCDTVAHSAASKGNDQVRMETAIAAQNPRLSVIAPVRQWNLTTFEDKIRYAKKRGLPLTEQDNRPATVTVDRNLWGTSLYIHDLNDLWESAPQDSFVLTATPEKAPNESETVTIGFETGVPCSLNGQAMGLLPLVRELNRLGGLHAIGRSDVVEDRLFGIKSRELYEAPAATLLVAAHRDLQSLVQSREMIHIREVMSRRYAELVYMGFWFNDLRLSLQAFFNETQKLVTGEVRLKLYKGSYSIEGRRSPHSLYNTRLANQTNQELFDSQWAQGFTSLWALASRLAALQQPGSEPN